MPLSEICCKLIATFSRTRTVGRWLVEQPRTFHTSSFSRFLDARDKDHAAKEKQLVVHQGEYFDEAAKTSKNKQTFLEVVQFYLKKNAAYSCFSGTVVLSPCSCNSPPHGTNSVEVVSDKCDYRYMLGDSRPVVILLRRGHVEFIYAALSRMKDFETNRDLDTYKKLLEVFPKGKMIPTNVWQVEMMHYPKQQQCCIDVLDQMEANGVIPDDDMGYQLRGIFGDKCHAFRKYRRMMYWMPKFRFANPYYVPYNLPTDQIELAKLALKRMAVDLENEVSVFMAEELTSAADRTYIVSSHSPLQSHLIRQHSSDKPVFVEGGFKVWLRSESLTYFVLRSDCTENYSRFQETKQISTKQLDTFQWSLFEEEKPKSIVIPPSVHEQEDGTVLAMCITGTSSKDSLASWIRFLEKKNPKLSEIPVLFLLRTPEAEVRVIDEKKQNSEVMT